AGNQLTVSKIGKDNDRILAGENLDLGGQALWFYRNAQTELRTTTSLAQQAKGTEINGKQIDDQEIAGLQQSAKYVQDRVDVIYGAHNIPGVMQKLKEAYRGNIEGFTH